MSFLNTAYHLGAQQAQAAFEKHAADVLGSPAAIAGLGAMPVAGPALAGLASQYAGPQGTEDIVGPATAARSQYGQLLGGLGGAALGSGGLALARELGWDKRLGLQDTKPSTAALIGALLGTGLGGAVGAHQGRQRGQRTLGELAELNQAENQALGQSAYHQGQQSALSSLYPNW